MSLETHLIQIRKNIEISKTELKKIFYKESKRFFQKYNYLKSYGTMAMFVSLVFMLIQIVSILIINHIMILKTLEN